MTLHKLLTIYMIFIKNFLNNLGRINGVTVLVFESSHQAQFCNNLNIRGIGDQVFGLLILLTAARQNTCYKQY